MVHFAALPRPSGFKGQRLRKRTTPEKKESSGTLPAGSVPEALRGEKRKAPFPRFHEDGAFDQVNSPLFFSRP